MRKALVTSRSMALSLSRQLHIVHYNSAEYSSFEDAKDKPNGLAVLAFLYAVGFTSEQGQCVVSLSHSRTLVPSRAARPAYRVTRLSQSQADQCCRRTGRSPTFFLLSVLCLGGAL